MECDFCSSQNVVRHFPCRDFDSESAAVGVRHTTQMGQGTNLVLLSKNYWAACPVCAEMVDNHNVEGLVDRAMVSLDIYSRLPTAAIKFRTHITWTYIQFFQNRLPEGPCEDINTKS